VNIVTRSIHSRFARSLSTIMVSALLIGTLSSPAFANDADAKLAIGRAQASLDLVSKEGSTGTSDQSFARAQQKLVDAQAQLTAGRETEAVWFATEAELLAETALGAAKLETLEQTRRSVSKDNETLQLEIRRN